MLNWAAAACLLKLARQGEDKDELMTRRSKKTTNPKGRHGCIKLLLVGLGVSGLREFGLGRICLRDFEISSEHVVKK
jgi:hypothetical protein